jgi:putative ABC transport system ATP-binding protein
MNTVLELRAVSKTFLDGADEVHALREVDLTVEPGRMVAVTRAPSFLRALVRGFR